MAGPTPHPAPGPAGRCSGPLAGGSDPPVQDAVRLAPHDAVPGGRGSRDGVPADIDRRRARHRLWIAPRAFRTGRAIGRLEAVEGVPAACETHADRAAVRREGEAVVPGGRQGLARSPQIAARPIVFELGPPSSRTTTVTLPSAVPSSASRPSQQSSRSGTVSAVHCPAVERVAERSATASLATWATQTATNSPFERTVTRGRNEDRVPGIELLGLAPRTAARPEDGLNRAIRARPDRDRVAVGVGGHVGSRGRGQ